MLAMYSRALHRQLKAMAKKSKRQSSGGGQRPGVRSFSSAAFGAMIGMSPDAIKKAKIDAANSRD